MKLQKQLTRAVEGKEYFKWVVVIPSGQIEKLGWDDGLELESIVGKNSLIIRPKRDCSERPKKMTYEEFKKIIKEELGKEPEGLTWTEIKQRRPELYQKVPNNLWVRTLEQEIGLVREKRTDGKTIWRLSKRKGTLSQVQIKPKGNKSF